MFCFSDFHVEPLATIMVSSDKKKRIRKKTEIKTDPYTQLFNIFSFSLFSYYYMAFIHKDHSTYLEK